MPVIRDIALTLDMEQVLQHPGIGKRAKSQQLIVDTLNELMAIVDQSHLIRPAVSYKVYPISYIHQDQIHLSNDVVLQSSFIASTLSTAKELATVVCTIGPGLEQKATNYFRENEPLRGFILDSIGSTAVDLLSREACHIISCAASSRNYQASSPISPGMSELAISQQQLLFELASAREIGVSLTSLQVMVPRKSTSMVICLGPEMATWTKAEVCGRCNLKKTCRYRVPKVRQDA